MDPPVTGSSLRSTETRGRKRVETEPQSKKQAQVRAAQRKFQERKKQLVDGLRQRVAELEAENAALRRMKGPLPAMGHRSAHYSQRPFRCPDCVCPNCVHPSHSSPPSRATDAAARWRAPLIPSVDPMALDAPLNLSSSLVPLIEPSLAPVSTPTDDLLQSLISTPADGIFQALRFGNGGRMGPAASMPDQPAASPSPSNTGTPVFPRTKSEEWLDVVQDAFPSRKHARANTRHPAVAAQSASEMYGEPRVEFARYILKKIPSLQGCVYVDHLFDVFLQQAACRERKTIEASMIYLLYAWCKIMAIVTDPAERRLIYEMDEIFHNINHNHMIYYYGIGAQASETFEELVGNMEPPQASEGLKHDLLNIPSFHNEVAAKAINELCYLYYGPINAEMRFFRVGHLIQILQDMCVTSDDRACFLGTLDSLEGPDEIMDSIEASMKALNLTVK
ncbi:hypothetical protein BC830DRAFT_1168235 [Chytriomyces sp. MP71]|nr:hypothetical protein BC830DRAFT_1168235 [Chytriomyces sp. MP71]